MLAVLCRSCCLLTIFTGVALEAVSLSQLMCREFKPPNNPNFFVQAGTACIRSSSLASHWFLQLHLESWRSKKWPASSTSLLSTHSRSLRDSDGLLLLLHLFFLINSVVFVRYVVLHVHFLGPVVASALRLLIHALFPYIHICGYLASIPYSLSTPPMLSPGTMHTLQPGIFSWVRPRGVLLQVVESAKWELLIPLQVTPKIQIVPT